MSESPKAHPMMRFFRTLAYCAVMFLVLLTALPEVIRLAAIYALEEAGADAVAIDDIDLNLFTGEVGVSEVTVGPVGEPEFSLTSLDIHFEWLPLLDKRVELASIALVGLNLSVLEDDGEWHVVIPIPAAAGAGSSDSEPVEDDVEPGTPWGIGIHRVSLQDLDIDVDALGVTSNLEIEILALSDLASWAPMDMSEIVLKGSVNGSPIHIDANAQPFSTVPTLETHITLDKLSLAPLAPFVSAYVPDYAGRVSIDTDLFLQMGDDGAIELTQKGTLALAVDRLSHADVALENSDITWDGQLTVKVPVGAKPLVHTEGVLSSQALQASIPAVALTVRHGGIAWKGKVDIDLADLEQSIQVAGDVSVEQLAIVDNQLPVAPLSLERLALDSLALEGLRDIRLQRARLVDATWLQSTAEEASEAVMQWNLVQATGIGLEDQHALNIDRVLVDSVDAEVAITESGKVAHIDAYVATVMQRVAALESEVGEGGREGKAIESGSVPEEKNVEPSSDAPAKQPFVFVVKQFDMEGGNRIQFTDRSISPVFQDSLHIDTFSVGLLDSRAPAKPTPLDIQLRVGEFSKITGKGGFTPLMAASPNGALDVDVTGLDLTVFSAYVERASGYAVGSGQFNLDTAMKFDAGKIDATNEVLLKQLILTPKNDDLIASVSKQLTMPVGVSLGLLKDSDGNIELSIPIKGDLSDPNVSIRSVVALASVQAVKKGTLSYLKYAIQPYGAILLVGEQVGEMVMEVKLAPIRFDGNQAIVTAEDQAYLPKLVTVLENRPGLTLKMCPVLTVEDLIEGEVLALNERLLGLSTARLGAIKQALVAEYGIAAERILLCRATLGEGEPRVELEL